MSVLQERTTTEYPRPEALADIGARPLPPPTVSERAALPWKELIPALAAVALLVVLSKNVLLSWAGQYTKPESYYAHAPIIPVVVALMLWYRRDALRAVPKTPCLGALVLLVPALGLFQFAAHNHAMALQSLAFLFILWASVWLVLGTQFWKAAAFPLLFVAFMMPLPGPVLNDATVPIQRQSTHFANSLLHVMGFATTLTGNLITLDSFALSVDTPCSGLHTLLALITIGSALTYLMDGPLRRRLWLLVASLPLSLFVNSVRIALIGVCGECISPQAAHVFHDWSGTLTQALGVVLLLLIAKGLGCRKFAGWPIF